MRYPLATVEREFLKSWLVIPVRAAPDFSDVICFLIFVEVRFELRVIAEL